MAKYDSTFQSETKPLTGHRWEVTIQVTTPWLGSTPADKELATRFVMNRYEEKFAGDKEANHTDEEVDAIPEPISPDDVAMTVFLRDPEGNFAFSDHVVRGFLKTAIQTLRDMPGTLTHRVSKARKGGGEDGAGALGNYKQRVDRQIFVEPRLISIVLPPGKHGGAVNERPLRATTAQGPRNALARSEELPIGSQATFEIEMIGDLAREDLLREWLDYGARHGFGQWRGSGGYGRFEYRVRPAGTMAQALR